MKMAIRPLPREYRREIPAGPLFARVNEVIATETLHTICVSGKCPNRGECFSRGSLAFMILGDVCTRRCGFCAVKSGAPRGAVDQDEPERLARAAAALALRHVVVTAVARDDLPDGGAGIFAQCVRALHRELPAAVVEILTSDFNAAPEALDCVLSAAPDIYNHNMETVERLTPRVRSRATYRRSLDVLGYVKARAGQGNRTMKIKSGLMLGLGETREEVRQTLVDLRAAGCDYLTLGQYLQPSARHFAVQSFIPVSEFSLWRETALDLGFERVASGPLVRSSYFADAMHARA